MTSVWQNFFQRWSGLLQQIGWLDVSTLYFLFLVPLFAIILYFGYVRLAKRLLLAQTAVPSSNRRVLLSRRAWQKSFLICFASVLIVVASAGPRLGWRWIESRQSGMDIVVAIDLSRSMMATDLEPSRLEQARRMVIDLLEVAAGDRIGLVIFAGSAFVQCPLTSDHQAVMSFLDELNVDMVPVGGTDLSGALRESLRALGAGGESAGQGAGRLIVMLTDGEGHEGDLNEAITEVVKSQAKVITVGMATSDGSPIADRQGGFIKDQSGNVVISRLTETTLKDIAKKTSGEYVRADAAEASVARIYEDIIRNKGTVRELQVRKQRQWFEKFQWPAGLALALLCIELLIRDVGVRSLILPFFLSLLFFVKEPALANNKDIDVYNDAIHSFDAGKEDQARADFERLSQTASGEVLRRAHYNLGNILAKSGQYQDAVKHYEAALAMDPQDQQVRDNLKWTRSRSESKEKQDQQKQDQQKQDQQKQDQQKQDQQKQDQQKQDQQKQDQQKQDQQKQDQQKQDQQKAEMTSEDAEKLLRSAPDDRRNVRPLYRRERQQPQNVQQNW